ncbi:RNA polymerase sigma factor RpoH [Defluviicoccus vanus]|uniref:RNA polymerase sigma factor RpoH n=1 Tax=Defluviicoccus vanus TaxID=111831 RepID=A0A7H1N0J8_9PROT|nr:RNA polymerase sigma factor RpoH [Defluviicoccus vanus]QNT69234.1 RNA polymerase sigma factor RpoH [Defluviicoccus vanus]
MASLTLPNLQNERSLTRYYREIWQFPVLKPEEEYMLAVRWQEHGDVEAAHRLVTSHLRLVAKIASGYRGYGLPVADLIAEGNIGLMKAVKKFEPQRGFRLATYAMWWIRASITEYILRSWSMVKMGTLAAQKKLFFSLGRIKRKLSLDAFGSLEGENAETVARSLDVATQDVIDMDRRLSSPDVSLNAPRSREDAEGAEFMDTLVDESPSPEAQVAASEEGDFRRGLLDQALATLPERERDILTQRQLREDPMTLEQLGVVYGISRERVRQLEARALDRLKKTIIGLAAASGTPVPALA